MPFNINTFIQQGLVYGGARPSLFTITAAVPTGIGIDTTTISKFRMVCRASEIPPSQMASIEVPYMGRKIKVIGNRVFPDWTVTVMNDEDFSVRAMLETWSNAMNRLESNVADPAVGSGAYKTDFSIDHYAKDGSLIREYTLYGAFPTVIGPITLDWDQTNTIETFTVQFSYDYWKPSIEQSSYNAGGINTYNTQADTDGPLGPN